MYHDYDMKKIIEHISQTKKKKLIVDTDTFSGLNDPFAAAYAMVADDIELLAVTAAPFSDCPASGMKTSYDELVKVRDFISAATPCYRGSAEYMKNIITPSISEAAENIVRIVNEADDVVYIAVLGCCTNVASALLLDPSIADKAVIILLGSQKSETEPANGANIAQDRNAARVIFECGVPVVFHPAVECGYIPRVATNVEFAYYFEEKCGDIGRYLYKNFIEPHAAPLDECECCNITLRPVFDIAAISFVRNADSVWTKIKPALSIDKNGGWVDLNTDRKMIYVDGFERDRIMSDFFNTISPAKIK